MKVDSLKTSYGMSSVIFILLVMWFCIFMTQAKKQHFKPHISSTPRAPREIPVFRPLRRLIQNFIPSRTAYIKIVFQRSVMPRMRWFVLQPSKNLPNAELPNMISIEGDKRYRVRVISSHDITAVTLSISGVGEIFPVKIVTCFSIDSAQFQYQLDTTIDEATPNRTDKLDGIIWTVIPERVITFNDLGQLSVSCTARLERESSRFTDELNIYRSYLERNQLNGTTQVSSVGTGKIHKERDNYVEESGKYLYKGSREVVMVGGRQSHVLYEVSFTVLNGSQDDVGVYTCAGERAKDRTYISSLVKVQQQQKPVVILLPCGNETVNHPPGPSRHSRPVDIHLIRNRTTCIRCRIFDYESAWDVDSFDEKKAIWFRKDDELIHRSRDSLFLDWHLNVADGGLVELTITFQNPSASDAGVYQCEARNSLGTDTTSFRVIISA